MCTPCCTRIFAGCRAGWMRDLPSFTELPISRMAKVYVGAPPPRALHLRGQTLIPIEKLLAENPFVAYRGDDRRIDLFYAESWALVHYCEFAPGMEKGKKLVQFYNKVQPGEKQKKAFIESLGSLEEVQKALDIYVQKFAFGSYVMSPPEQSDTKSYASRTTSVAETESAIGGCWLWTHDLPEAREMIQAALNDDPQLGELHEEWVSWILRKARTRKLRASSTPLANWTTNCICRCISKRCCLRQRGSNQWPTPKICMRSSRKCSKSIPNLRPPTCDWRCFTCE
jgi:hypothetical protein